MKIIAQSHISFEASRKNEYTSNQIKIMREMKKNALAHKWFDIYTGKEFSRENLPTIEHIIPCSNKNNPDVKILIKNGFQLNGLDNIFPVGSLGNSSRKSEPFKKTVLEAPIILDRLYRELSKYAKYKSGLIDGKTWVDGILKTLLIELRGISSEVKTRRLIP